MPAHAAEIEAGDARIQALEAGRFPERDPTLLDGVGNVPYRGVVRDLPIVRVGFVHAAGVRPDHVLFQCPQFLFVTDEAEDDRLQPRRTRIVFLVGIRRRGNHGVHGLRGKEPIGVPGVGLDDPRRHVRPVLMKTKVVNDGAETVRPRFRNRGVVLDPADADFRAEFEIADAVDEGVRQCQPSALPLLGSAKLVNGIKQHQRLVQRKRTDRIPE